MLLLNEKYKMDECFDLEVREDKYLYTDLVNGNWFRTNGSGSEFLQKFDGTLNIRTVIEQYAKENGFPSEFIEKKMTPFLQRAIDRKLLIRDTEEHITIQNDFSEYPNDLWIHLTDTCNMHCPFCYSSSGDKGIQKLDLGNVIRFVEKIPYEKRNGIIISGGEPFLYPDLPELVKELKALAFKITIISNGTAGNDKYKDVLPYINALQISVDGSTEEIYQCTRGKGNFPKVVKSLNLAHELGVRNIVVSFTTNKYNIDDMANMADFARRNHVNHIHITKIIPSGRANDIMDKIVPTAEEYAVAIQKLGRAIIQTNNYITMLHESDEAFLPEEGKTRFVAMTVSSDPVRKTLQQTKISSCSLGCGTLSIGFDGNIYPCGCLHHDYTKLGTIEEDINAIMERGHRMGLEYSVDNPELSDCNVCRYKYICGGGCRACADSTGNMKAKDPMCDFYIHRIEEVMWNSPMNLFEQL